MKFEQQQILSAMEATGIIPVFNHTDIDTAIGVLDAAYKGGVKVFEFTNRGANALEVFTALSAHAEQYEDLVLGIGTIFKDEDARKFLDAGAHFVVSPAFIPTIGVYCNSQQVLWIPGCGTVTEIFNAKELGAQVIKAFPGNVLGPAFISSVKAVFPKLPMMPTGGVEPTKENLSAWFKAGVTCVGMGSQLFKKEWIQGKDYATLEQEIAKALALVQEIKSNT
ncbi:MAG TPA: bifunctional 4-hydroxy-2-oxoglutarate aldolase/2-dehydro-3-deoxy-phosphogluconate aldolase [Cyclobacteriaceae bacterium]|nr:bifunctional 4-hydroxy-2-oxoglutarate aldolase/2-dehydro-3-deoxy-phosphogluconate aldolase [Cyclobacteriaceae bacterium]